MVTRRPSIAISIMTMLMFLLNILSQIVNRCKPHTGSWLDFVSTLLALGMVAFGARAVYLGVTTLSKSKLDKIPAEDDAKKQGCKRGMLITSIIYAVVGIVFFTWSIIADGYRARTGKQLDFIWELAPLLALLFWGLVGVFLVIKLEVKPKKQT